MGFFWEGLPPYVLDWSRALLGPDTAAVETGTFRGDTSLLLAERFSSCFTIERSSALAAKARERFANDPRVTILEGSSRDRLREAMPDAGTACFFWLDAHGIYDYQGPDTEENPLLEELAIIADVRANSATIIAIDDARGLGTQPGWPSLGEVSAVLESRGFASVNIDDCVIAVPKQLNPDFWDLYQKSRIVEVSALFHVWNRVTSTVRNRKRLDAIVSRFR